MSNVKNINFFAGVGELAKIFKERRYAEFAGWWDMTWENVRAVVDKKQHEKLQAELKQQRSLDGQEEGVASPVSSSLLR